jgi:hypothetical protein
LYIVLNSNALRTILLMLLLTAKSFTAIAQPGKSVKAASGYEHAHTEMMKSMKKQGGEALINQDVYTPQLPEHSLYTFNTRTGPKGYFVAVVYPLADGKPDCYVTCGLQGTEIHFPEGIEDGSYGVMLLKLPNECQERAFIYMRRGPKSTSIYGKDYRLMAVEY